MTDRAEIERLLQMTGRTLEGLPKHYPVGKRASCILDIVGAAGLNYPEYKMAIHILHQSDVIELLVGALRDALDKPMQKPLTMKEGANMDEP